MAQPRFHMPEYILPTSSLHPNRMQQVLPHYSVSRNHSLADGLNYCNGGVISVSTIIDGCKYNLKAGLVTMQDENFDPSLTKVRVITVIANGPDGIPRDDGFYWDSGSDHDVRFSLVTGHYKSLFNLYRMFGGELPQHLDNSLRIASGFYNTMRMKGIEPAAFTDHKKMIRTFCTTNWAELLGEWTISPISHHSLCEFPLLHMAKEDYPSTYRACVNRRNAKVQAVPQDSLPPPSYFEAMLSHEYGYRDFLKVISILLSTRLGESHEMVLNLFEGKFRVIDPDAVLLELAAYPEYRKVISAITENRQTIPVDPIGLCPRIFLLAFQDDTDFLYRCRKLINTDQGVVPWTWPTELFGNIAIKPYCTEQESGAWIRNEYVPKNVPLSILGNRTQRQAQRMLWDSLSPQLLTPLDQKEVDSFIGFLKVADPNTAFGSFLGYDVSRDPGPLALTNGMGGKVFRPTSWKFSRMLYPQCGIGYASVMASRYPPGYAEGLGGIQAVTPLCNGTVHYISPPIAEEVLDSTFDQVNGASRRNGLNAHLKGTYVGT